MNTSASIKGEFRAFAEWATDLTWASISSVAQHRVRMVILDDLGAILAGSSVPEVSALRLLYDQTGSRATVLAAGFPRMSTHDAVEVNGIACSWLEVDEGYRFAMNHGGLYTIPVSMALAEQRDARINDVGLAVIVGYELGARLARHFQFPTRTIHSHGTFSPIAAAAAASKLLELDSDAFLRAITAACSLALASPFDHAPQGALSRNLWAGSGGRSGLLAAEAAACGIGGLVDAADTVFCGLLQATPTLGKLTDSLGDRLAIEDGYHKPFACCQYLHSSIEATLELRERNPDRDWPKDVVSIKVATHAAALALPDRQPATVLGAKFSLPHAVAAAVVRGTGGPGGFDTSSLSDGQMQRVRDLVEGVELPLADVSDRPARVAVTFADGKVVTADCPSARGEPGRPFLEIDLVTKFTSLTEEILSGTAARDIGALLLDTHSEFSIRDLVGKLKAGAV